uniref:Interferon alpha and beta receptor subunit 1 n=1 Tax=Latimeria chalumnae TaxID=7897 RepID=H3A002_LATCH
MKVLLNGSVLILFLGAERLFKPRQVKVEAVNTQFILRWIWNHQSNRNVTFTAQYKTLSVFEWKTLAGCEYIANLECDFSDMKLDFFKRHNLRVGAMYEKTVPQWSEPVQFTPVNDCKIGPPAVKLNFSGDRLDVQISDPRTHENESMSEYYDLSYNVVYWKNTSDSKSKISTRQSVTIYDLKPLMVYCVQVQAFAFFKPGIFSPVQCKATTAEERFPCPKNLHFEAVNRRYILKWDCDSNLNITFTVQYQSAFCSSSERAYSRGWKTVSGCERVTAMQCECSSELFYLANYYVRVRVENHSAVSAWSKELNFIPQKDGVLGPPTKVEVEPGEGRLDIRIWDPVDHENKSMRAFMVFSYRVLFWKNTSDPVVKVNETKQTTLILSGLEPLTVYCLKVQAVTVINKTGHFSPVHCQSTTAEGRIPIWLTVIVVLVSMIGFFIISVLCFFCTLFLYRGIKYTFFPSYSLPSNIQEILYKSSQNIPFLNLQPEQCCDRVCVVSEQTGQILNESRDCNKHRRQPSRDSGHYSNETDTSGSGVSEDFSNAEMLN